MGILRLAYYTYIVECSDGTFYTGKTFDVNHRLKQHNGVLPGGARYTKIRRPVKLVHCEQYATNKFACQRESKIKQLTHQQKKRLIEDKTAVAKIEVYYEKDKPSEWRNLWILVFLFAK